MDVLPKVVQGCSKGTVSPELKLGEKTSKNCNICRNFKNINDRKHRMSKAHQKKLTERLRIIRLKMKINKDSVTVHDEDWGQDEEFFCYFCDEPVKKHKKDAEFTIEFLGLMIHHTESHHMEAVKSYLRNHGRNEKWEIFCKTKRELENFMSKIPKAKRKYLRKLDSLNEKDVRQIKETDVERQHTVESYFLQLSSGMVKNERKLEPSSTFHKKKHNYNSKNIETPKIAPWLVGKSENESNVKLSADKPVIGPTMETLVKHVELQAKKGLSLKRVKANLKQKNVGTSKWLPAFSGVWSKGRHRQLKVSTGQESQEKVMKEKQVRKQQRQQKRLEKFLKRSSDYFAS